MVGLGKTTSVKQDKWNPLLRMAKSYFPPEMLDSERLEGNGEYAMQALGRRGEQSDSNSHNGEQGNL